ncbi:MAG TPA: DUF4062 domain-containing protein [Thermoanaerobaculia bacterium]|nr:DUF4062 domain-containing protein [Thermoanaerobaculia bacterium]
MNEPLRVYLISTFSDLAEYRVAVVDVLMRYGLTPILLENLPAADQTPIDAIYQEINDADIVIVLLAHRLGSTMAGAEKSVVELEYERAKSLGKTIFAFVVDEETPWPPNRMDHDLGAVQRFKAHLLRDHLVFFFTTPHDLAVKVAVAVSGFLATGANTFRDRHLAARRY